jgi:hypothetical protein
MCEIGGGRVPKSTRIPRVDFSPIAQISHNPKEAPEQGQTPV